MKAILICTLVTLTFAAIPTDVSSTLRAFVDFKNTYNRQYVSPAEEAHRFGCFHQNLQRINEYNAKDTATYGINHFADLCADEFKSMYHNLKITKNNYTATATHPVPKVAFNGSFDWREHGAVNAVKNQANCGSCWTFSAVAAMEGAWVVSGKHKLESFSEEELCQCAKSAGDGCNGGDMVEALNWVINNGGIDTEADYPYTSGTGTTGTCNTAKLSKKVGKFSEVLRAGTEESTYADFLVANGPLSIGVDAGIMWQLYTGGVKNTCGGNQVDHGVAIVGVGIAENGEGYWTVRNSWGATWGENGYIRLKRGVNCNLLTTEVSTVKSK